MHWNTGAVTSAQFLCLQDEKTPLEYASPSLKRQLQTSASQNENIMDYLTWAHHRIKTSWTTWRERITGCEYHGLPDRHDCITEWAHHGLSDVSASQNDNIMDYLAWAHRNANVMHYPTDMSASQNEHIMDRLTWWEHGRWHGFVHCALLNGCIMYVETNLGSVNTSVEILDVQVNVFCDVHVRVHFVQLTFALSAVINATLIGPL